MSGPIRPPLTVEESDGSIEIRPTNTISFDSSDFNITQSGTTATITSGGTAGTIGGSITEGQVAFGAATADSIEGSDNFTFTEETVSEGPTILLTGNKPFLKIQDDTAATDYYTEWQQSGASFYWFSKDSTGANKEMIRVGPNYVFINDDGEDIDVKIEGSTVVDLFKLDAGQDNIGIGGAPQVGTTLQVKGANNFDPDTSTLADMYNTILIDGSAATGGDGAYGGAIAFTGVGSGRRRAAIAAVQTTSDSDEVGLSFFTHDASSPSSHEILQEHMRLDDNGRLFVSDTDIGTTTASARLHVRTTGTSNALILESTDDGATVAPNLQFFRNSGSPAVSDYIGSIEFTANDDGGAQSDIGRIYCYIEDETALTENGVIILQVAEAGSLRNNIVVGSTLVSVNASQRNVDFRVLSDDGTINFYSDAGQNNVGFGRAPDLTAAKVQIDVGNSTQRALDLISDDSDADAAPTLRFHRESSSPGVQDATGQIEFSGKDLAGNEQVYATISSHIVDPSNLSEDGDLRIKVMVGGSEQEFVRFNNFGVIFNELSVDQNFKVESNGNASMFVVDGGLNMVSVGGTAVSGGADFQVPNGSMSSYCNIKAVRSDSVATMVFVNDDLQGQTWINDSSTAWTLDLPESPLKGEHFYFVSTNGNMTVDPNPSGGTSNTLNGGTGALTRSTDYEVYHVICYATNKWLITNPA